ncbi:MAG: lipoyl(octanoyl) transferase LipB [Anaerolineae bacterium]|nr:lipoyl(octanoyl) transferase LipB [Anaerolineae bacterium]
MSLPLDVQILGLIPYQTAWDLQTQISAEVARGERPPTLLLLEHPHTFTFGRRGKQENLLWDETERAQRGVEVHWVDRGGDVTYHGPGQLVGYPIIPLTPALPSRKQGGIRADYVGYVRKLEKTLIKTLAELGLVTGQIEGLTGVWVQPDVASRCRHCPPASKKQPSKIAAIGVKVDVKGITRHGFALNVNTDMEYWDGINGCGLDAPIVNLADLLYETPSMEEVTGKFIDAFQKVFGYETVISEAYSVHNSRSEHKLLNTEP